MPLENPQDQAAIDAYMTHLEAARGRQARTVEAYRLALARLAEFMEGRSILTASDLELEAFAGLWLHKRGVVARSRKPYVSAVRGFFSWARRRGLVQHDPAAELAHPKTAKPLPHALSLDNAERLMWAPDLSTFAGLRDATMMAMLLGCGLRVSGLVGLNEGDLSTVQIDGKPRMLVRTTEKGQKERLVPMPREAEMLMRVYLEHEELQQYDRDVTTAKGRPDRVLFVNTNNRTVPAHEYRGEAVRLGRRSVWRAIQDYGQKLGIPAQQLHPHAFRHLFGTELAEDDVDLITRADLMGHSDPKSTAIYTSLSMRRKAKVVDASAPIAKIKSPVSELIKRL